MVKLHLSVSQVCETGQAQLQMFAVTLILLQQGPILVHPLLSSSPIIILYLSFSLLLLPDPVLLLWYSCGFYQFQHRDLLTTAEIDQLVGARCSVGLRPVPLTAPRAIL